MKVYNIFKKNIKIVSRNWSYFAVLFLCPLLLILISGLMLNSNDFDNLRVGVINEDPGYNLNLKSLKNTIDYSSLTECLYELTNQKNSVCFHVYEVDGVTQIDVYLDNTVKIIEYYARQFILDNVLSEQAQTFYRTSEELNAKLIAYSTSIVSAKQELNDSLTELDDQERTLTEYRENLSRIRSDFDAVYWPIKNMEPSIKALKANFNSSRQALENNISNFRSQEYILLSNMAILKSFLSTRLSPTDYDYASQNLDAISASLTQIDASLVGIEQVYYSPELFMVINNLDLIIANLDSIKELLDKLDSDLALSIQRTQNSKVRIQSFIVRLDEISEDISQISGSLAKDKVNLEFKNAFEISQDPVFLAFPILVTIIITFTSLVLSNMFILKQVNQPSYQRDLITPTKDIHFLIADYLTNLFFISIQVAILFAIGFYWFSIPAEIISIFVITILLASSALIFMGMSIGYLVKQQNLSILLTISLVMLLLIFSDLIVPSVLSGPIIKSLIELNIFVMLDKILTDSLLLHKPLYLLTSWIVRLTILLVSFAIIAYLSRKISKGTVTRKWPYVILILFILTLSFIFSALQQDSGARIAQDFLRIVSP